MVPVRELLRGIPGLYWIALVFTVMALWTRDVRGIAIALICAVLGTVQLYRMDR